MSKTKSGFTLVELLIVIVVIAILAAITIVAYNGVQAKARDSARASALSSIANAIAIYNVANGGVPLTDHYSSTYTLYHGWDVSTSADWLKFLRTDNGMMPVDPVNKMTTADNNPPSKGNFALYYYCYSPVTYPTYSVPTVKIGYNKDDGTSVQQSIVVNACL